MLAIVTPYLGFGDGERFVLELTRFFRDELDEAVSVVITHDAGGPLANQLLARDADVFWCSDEEHIRQSVQGARLVVFHETAPLLLKVPAVLWLDSVTSHSRHCFAQAIAAEVAAVFCSSPSIWLALTVENRVATPLLMVPHPATARQAGPLASHLVPAGDVNLTYVGRVTAEHLLEPLVAVLPAFANVHLRVVGWGPGMDVLVQQGRRLGLDKHRLSLDEHPQSWPIMAQLAEITTHFVSPLDRGLSRCIFEGMAWGVPAVVASRHDYEMLFAACEAAQPAYAPTTKQSLYDLQSEYITALATLATPGSAPRSLARLNEIYATAGRFGTSAAVRKLLQYANA